MDSLKAHESSEVAHKVREWLNFEWKRSDHAEKSGNSEPFTTKSMPLFKPKSKLFLLHEYFHMEGLVSSNYLSFSTISVPQQDNTCDCGVFVCRYAHAVYKMYRNRVWIRRKDIRVPEKFGQRKLLEDHVITNSSIFNFCASDVRDLRDKIKKLVNALSKIYLERRSSSENLPTDPTRSENLSPESQVRSTDLTNREFFLTLASSPPSVAFHLWKKAYDDYPAKRFETVSVLRHLFLHCRTKNQEKYAAELLVLLEEAVEKESKGMKTVMDVACGSDEDASKIKFLVEKHGASKEVVVANANAPPKRVRSVKRKGATEFSHSGAQVTPRKTSTRPSARAMCQSVASSHNDGNNCVVEKVVQTAPEPV